MRGFFFNTLIIAQLKKKVNRIFKCLKRIHTFSLPWIPPFRMISIVLFGDTLMHSTKRLTTVSSYSVKLSPLYSWIVFINLSISVWMLSLVAACSFAKRSCSRRTPIFSYKPTIAFSYLSGSPCVVSSFSINRSISSWCVRI